MNDNSIITDDIDENLEDGEDTESTTVDDPDENTDNVGDPSVEINVEDLIHELEAQGLSKRIGKEQDARRRLEELMERKRARRELEDFDDYEI